MGAKTLNPDGDAVAGTDADGAPGTLAAGELVWAKPKGRRTHWWPARLRAACAAAAARDVDVSYFGDSGTPRGRAAQVRRFADPDADSMARGSTGRAFLAAVREAHASAVAALRSSLTCGCVPSPEASDIGCAVVGVANLSPAEFLAALRDAAVDCSTVGLVDRARLKSWVRPFGEGWGPAGAGRNPRRTPEELVDKIDLDVPAGDGKEDDECLPDAEKEHEASERPQETPAPQKKRRAAAQMDVENKNDSAATGTGTSGKRERKRSKYLSPPYTESGVILVKLSRKATDSPKAVAVNAADSDNEVLSGSIGVVKVLSLILNLAKDVTHGSHYQKPVEAFLHSYRTTEFKCSKFYEESPAEHAIEQDDVNRAAGMLFDSQTGLKQSKSTAKRSKKNDDGGGIAGSSIKRKKREKCSPAVTIGCDLPITPAIPIRQVKPGDIRSQMKSGGGARVLGVGVKDERFKPSVFKCEISPEIPETIKPGQEQVILSDQPAKESDEAKLNVEKKEPSLSECSSSAAVLGAVKSGQEQEVDEFAGKTLAIDSTFPELSVKKDDAKLGDEKSEPLVLKCPISADVPGTIKPGQEQVDQSSISAVTQVADNTLSSQSSENGEVVVGATKSETNVDNILIDVPTRSVQMEATGSEAKVHTVESVQSTVTDLPDANVSREAPESKAKVCKDEIVESIVTVTGSEAKVHADENKQSTSTELPDANVSREAPESEANVCKDEIVESIVTDLPVGNVLREALESKANVRKDETVQRVVTGVPVPSVGANIPMQTIVPDDVPVQNVGADVRVSSEPSTVNGVISQALDENREHSSLEMHTVRQSYASLQAMVPEMLNNVTNINGTDVTPDQKEKLTVRSMANYLSDQAMKDAGSDATNSTQKKKKKKTHTQLFVDPAEIIVEFTPGVIMPSREELLSAFGKFGYVIESQTNIAEVTRSARVVFGKRSEAESAYKRAEFLGEFGPPFATLKFGALPPIELSVPPPPHSRTSSPRPPLTDIKKSLEKMILARHSSLKTAPSADGLKPAPDKLLADMQGLLAHVDKMLSGQSTSTPP